MTGTGSIIIDVVFSVELAGQKSKFFEEDLLNLINLK
jgi:hypothetical protein